MKKIDLKKELKPLYNASVSDIVIVDVPTMNMIMVDGSGDPNTAQEYQDAIETIYSISYALKFIIKKGQDIDYGVMPLEGLWWTDDMTRFSIDNKSIWRWTAMIMQPDFITLELFERAVRQTGAKKKLSGLSKARFESLTEGSSVQLLHLGPFSDEGSNIEKLHKYVWENGYFFDGTIQKHHEIYLSDFRRTAPEKLKTILRQPFTRK